MTTINEVKIKQPLTLSLSAIAYLSVHHGVCNGQYKCLFIQVAGLYRMFSIYKDTFLLLDRILEVAYNYDFTKVGVSLYFTKLVFIFFSFISGERCCIHCHVFIFTLT